MPLAGFVLAALIIFLRNPGVLIHPQLWAEDGKVFYQDVSNLGFIHTVVLPQAGYFETLAVLVARVARFFPITDVPFVVTFIGLLAQALPVPVLLSSRTDPIIPDRRLKMLLVVAYVLLPNAPELDATVVNAQWFLAVAALLVVLSAPPKTRLGRVSDGAILLVCGLNGPFVILLALIAWALRFLRKQDRAVTWQLILLTACALLEIAALAVISHHDAHNPAVEPRPSPSLGASPGLFAALVGGRLILGSLIGEGAGLAAPSALQWSALAAGIAVVLTAVRAKDHYLVAAVVLAGGVLGGMLVRPSTASPAWPLLAALPPSSQRYYIIPQYVWFALMVWLAARPPWPVVRVLAAAAACAMLIVAIAGHWQFAGRTAPGYQVAARTFEHATTGASVTFPIAPPPWSMTINKH